MTDMKRIGILLFFFLQVCTLSAVPAYTGTVKVEQPDGTSVTLSLCGDEWLHFHVTVDGYTVVKDQRGYYVYAELADGQLQPTGLVAHDPEGRSEAEQAYLSETQKRLAPQADEEMLLLKQQVQEIQRQALARRRAGTFDYGNFKGIIILVQYNDRVFSRDDYPAIIYDMVNKENYTGYDQEEFTGSVYDYFNDNSQGKFKLQFDLAGPYTIDYSQYYPEGTKKAATLVRAAIKAADADVDFSQYDADGDGRVDNVFLIFAGFGSNFVDNDQRLIWPHHSAVYMTQDNITIRDYVCTTEFYGVESRPNTVCLDGIGTICHEFGHVIGLPDFYDTDYEKGGGQSDHPGFWSVMATGCYQNKGRSPVGYSLYERYSVGFIDEPQVINSTGSYILPPLNVCLTGYRIDSAVDNEFFLFENRQKAVFKWDAYLPGSGMLVHRVDKTNPQVWTMVTNKVNADPSHNYYEVVRAGGIPESGKETYGGSASDVFPGSGNVTELNNTTSPASLLSWAGKPTPWGLKNIKMDNEIISFDIEKADEPQGINPVTRGTDPSQPFYNLYGQRVTRQHKGLLIHNGKKVLNKYN